MSSDRRQEDDEQKNEAVMVEEEEIEDEEEEELRGEADLLSLFAQYFPNDQDAAKRQAELAVQLSEQIATSVARAVASRVAATVVGFQGQLNQMLEESREKINQIASRSCEQIVTLANSYKPVSDMASSLHTARSAASALTAVCIQLQADANKKPEAPQAPKPPGIVPLPASYTIPKLPNPKPARPSEIPSSSSGPKKVGPLGMPLSAHVNPEANMQRKRSASVNGPTRAQKKRLPACFFCKSKHYSNQCEEYPTAAARVARAISLGMCLMCMRRHSQAECVEKPKCSSCSGPHQKFFCENGPM